MEMSKMKSLKYVAAVMLSLALLGCGRHVKFSSNKGAISLVQTSSGELQVTSVSRQFIGDQLQADYQVAVTITHAGRTINLNAYMTPQASGFDSQSFGGDYYAMSTACASDSCDEFVGLYNYGNFGTGSIQFAVLYKANSSGSVSKESEVQGTSFNNAEDAYWTLKRMAQ